MSFSLLAQRDGYCHLCTETILKGTETRPTELSSKKIVWCHFNCISNGIISSSNEKLFIPVCKHWKTNGVCIFKVIYYF